MPGVGVCGYLSLLISEGVFWKLATWEQEQGCKEQPDCHSSTHAICCLKEYDIYMLLLVKLTKRRVFAVCYRLPFIELLVQYF